LDDGKGQQQYQTANEQVEHGWIRPTHGVPVIRLDTAGDSDQHRAETESKGDIAPPVDTALMAFAVVPQLAVGPERSEHSDPNVAPEPKSPVNTCQQTTGAQSDEIAGKVGHLIDAQGHSTLPLWERVGQDRHRICGEHRTADSL